MIMLNLLNSINMADSIWNSLIGASGSIISSIVNPITQNETNKQNYQMFLEQQAFEAEQARLMREFNKQESELAFEREKEMWNMQNEYNSPEQQMKRYQDAGLSPYLIYGQGSPGNATGTPSYSPAQAVKSNAISRPDKKAPQINLDTSLLAQYQNLQKDLELKDKNIEKIDSEIQTSNVDNSLKINKDKRDSEIHMLEVKYRNGLLSQQEFDTKLKELQVKYEEETYSNKVTQSNIQTELLKLDKDVKQKIITQYDTINQQNLKQNEKLSAEIALLQNQLGKEQFNKAVFDRCGIDLSKDSNPINNVFAVAGKTGLLIEEAINDIINQIKESIK